MMSSSKREARESDSGWRPLVPSDLEKFDREVISGPDLNDPEVARAFRALYERDGEASDKRFSLLYGPRREFDREHEEHQALDRIETANAHQAPDAPEPDPGPDLEAIRQEAYDAAFVKGEKDGFQSGLAEAREKAEHLSALIRDVEGMWSRIVKRYETEIVELALRVAEKVVYGRVEVDKEIITRAILDAFQKISDPVHAVITVNPDDYEYIEVVKEDFFEAIKGLKQVTLVSDPLVAVGGCRIETPSGEVETDIEERLDAVKRCVIESNR
jgi:flagellar assembly protein FliH